MKNKMSLPYLILIILSFLIIVPLFTAFREPVVNENESGIFASSRPIGNEKYIIDRKESVVTWKCSKVFANMGAHKGYVFISKGELMIEKDRLVGGTVEVDMNTIVDDAHRNDNNLIDHLKSVDFFDAKKFPASTFTITKVTSADSENTNVTGNLTIKGITHEVTFPAKTEVKDGVVNANGKVIIDRTKWDVRYGSGKFFDDLADKAISDDIEFEMKIVAKNSI